MAISNLQWLALTDGILVEAAAGENRIVLWLPGEQSDRSRHWERIANVGNATVSCSAGICHTAAVLVPLRQQVHGFFGKLLGRLRGESTESSWVLPNGEAAQACGPRQTDCILVWSEQEGVQLDDSIIKSSWPQSRRICGLGRNLFLAVGVEAVSFVPQPTAHDIDLRPAAEQMLAAARQTGNRRQQIAALTDLGFIRTRACEAKEAVKYLEEAVALAQELGDEAQEGDATHYLALAALWAGQAARARTLWEERLAAARASYDRFAEKKALEGLGMVCGSLRDPQQAIGRYEEARALAREVGDRQHEADLLWYEAIQFAEMNQRDRASATAEEAIEVLRNAGNPQAVWLTTHLRKYREAEDGKLGTDATAHASSSMAEVSFDSSVVVANWSAPPAVGPKQDAKGPGLLRWRSPALSQWRIS